MKCVGKKEECATWVGPGVLLLAFYPGHPCCRAWPSSNTPAGEEEERPASQQLEVGH